MSAKLHQSKDGSSTLYSSQFQQFYHNPNGAVTESLHVFFESPGVIDFIKNNSEISILEVGFGTGLNFILLLDLCKKLNPQIEIKFYSIEAFPVDPQTASDFNFKEHLHFSELNDELPDLFTNLKTGWNLKKPKIDLNAELHLYYGTFKSFDLGDLTTDFMFHDPFSPEVNAELWTDSVFSTLKKNAKPDTVLATYCAASKARGAMAAAGWKVARAAGALGKREMTLAALNPEQLGRFKRVNENKLAERYASGDFDH